MEWFTEISVVLGLVTGLFLLIGLLLLATAIARLRHRRPFSAGGRGLCSIALLALAVALAAMGLNLQTYQRLTHEREIAEIEFSQVAPQTYRARIHYPNTGRYEELDLRGDAWQIDARMLKWRGPAILAGLDSHYRLERISGRYDDIESERRQPRSVHQLSRNPGLDLWSISRRYQDWLPWLDAHYGSATYVPMRDGAVYRISVTQTGLIARAGNDSASEALESWY